jgi:ABC-type bacteriocin/lantibiotic exporter with double-glycine peptidase domain
MNSSPPLLIQERPDTCALACLRIVLAAFGVVVDEATLVRQAVMEPGGTAITEVARLAMSYGLEASVQVVEMEQLRSLMADGYLAIVYLNRRIFDLRNVRNIRRALREALIHCVVPTRITNASVLFHDPLHLQPQRRSRRRFAAAQAFLGNTCVICRPHAATVE